MLKVVDVTVTKTLWAARCALPNWLADRVRISKAKYWASTMIMPGRASRIIGPVKTALASGTITAISTEKETYPSC